MVITTLQGKRKQPFHKQYVPDRRGPPRNTFQGKGDAHAKLLNGKEGAV